MVKIEGNTFIVTGGCGGIGGAVAKDLVSRGANIIVFDVVPSEKGDGIIKSLASGASGKAVYMQTDIADDAVCGKTVAAALEHAKASGSKLVGLVHCAGIALRRPWSQKFADTIEGFGKMLHVNTFGTYVVNAHVADAINSQYAEEDEKRRKELTPNAKYPPRVEEERGTILNFASIAGHESTGRTLGYGPTKTAVLGMTKSFSDYLAPSGIRVNSVSPGIVASAMNATGLEWFKESLHANAGFPRTPAGPQDITHAVRYLLESTFTNGEDIKLTGAWRLATDWSADHEDPREHAPGIE